MLSDKSSFENRGLRDKLISHDHFRMVMWFSMSFMRFIFLADTFGFGHYLYNRLYV